MKIYVAGPYTAPTDNDRLLNTIYAMNAGIAILKKGHSPFIPHLSHYFDRYAHATGQEFNWEDYMQWDDAFLSVCDALYYMAPSKGADIELQRAAELGLKVYRTIEEIPNAIAGGLHYEDTKDA